MRALLLPLLLLSSAAAAEGLDAMPNDELCIAMAVGMITGNQDLKDTTRPELERRGEICAPADMYIKIAEARIGFMRAQAGQAPPPPVEPPEPSWRRRVGAAADAFLIMQRQQQEQRRQNTVIPSTTTCNTFEGMTTCHTR